MEMGVNEIEAFIVRFNVKFPHDGVRLTEELLSVLRGKGINIWGKNTRFDPTDQTLTAIMEMGEGFDFDKAQEVVKERVPGARVSIEKTVVGPIFHYDLGSRHGR